MAIFTSNSGATTTVASQSARNINKELLEAVRNHNWLSVPELLKEGASVFWKDDKQENAMDTAWRIAQPKIMRIQCATRELKKIIEKTAIKEFNESILDPMVTASESLLQQEVQLPGLRKPIPMPIITGQPDLDKLSRQLANGQVNLVMHSSLSVRNQLLRDPNVRRMQCEFVEAKIKASADLQKQQKLEEQSEEEWESRINSLIRAAFAATMKVLTAQVTS